MKTTTRWATALTAGLLSVSLAACGGDNGSNASSRSTAGTSAGATSAADAASTTDASAAQDAKPGSEVAPAAFVAMLKSPGEEKLSSYDTTMSMTSGKDTMKGSGSMNLGAATPSMDLTMDISGVGQAHMILVDQKMYMSMPGLTGKDTFVEVPKEQLGDMSSLEQIDITTLMDEWQKTATKVVFVGEEDVDGTTMRHYTVTSDPSKSDLAQSTGIDSAAASSAMPKEVVQEIWVDQDNFMRKAKVDVQGSALEMTMTNWGNAKKVTAPDPSKIKSMDELMPGGDGSGATG